MKCVCKFCKKEYNVSDWEESLVDHYNGSDLDVDADEDISPYRLDIEINPSKYLGFGECDSEEILFLELYSDMCDECKKDLIATLKLSIYNWKKGKGVL